jgi:hypothetical protein
MQEVRRLRVTVLKVMLGLSAAAGAFLLVLCAWVFVQMPGATARPNTFMIVEIYSSSQPQAPTVKIYLEAPSSASDLKFEGDSLLHEFRGVPHQQLIVPVTGVVVSGSGTISFGNSRIKVENGSIAIDQRSVSTCGSGTVLLGTPSFELRDNSVRPAGPLEIILGRNGWYFEGYIHLGSRLFTSSLIRNRGRAGSAEVAAFRLPLRFLT